MPFQLSPGVLVVEKDLTSIVPAVATSNGAFAGPFVWGPVLDPTLISSEDNLVARFGKPVDGNAPAFFTAANFLAYSNNMQVVRVDANGARNAVVSQSGTVTNISIVNGGSSYETAPTIVIDDPQTAGGVTAEATCTVVGGVVTTITITEPGSGYTSAPAVTFSGGGGADAEASATHTEGGIKVNNEDVYLTTYVNGAGLVGEFAAKYPGALGNSLRVSMADSVSFVGWAYEGEFDSAPGTSTFASSVGGTNDELHIIVIDDLGLWTGVAGTILEKFAFASKASDARRSDGANNYYRDVINNNSKYLWWMDHPSTVGNWGNAAQGTTFNSLATELDVVLSGGVDDLEPSDGQLQAGYALFRNAEIYDVSLIPVGHVSPAVAKYVVENVAEYRRDCVAFVSPYDWEAGQPFAGADAAENIVTFRTDASFNVNSSYAVLDSGYKYQYDRYNDVYRWIPLNGDIAGMCARTDYTNDPWWSPGGLNRGQVKSVVKLAFNPNKTERDELYKNGVNPVVSFRGQGTVLFGDKTLLSKPSAFDRINVRRLFIVLEKAIAIAARYQLFEFNDSFTRAQFRSMVEPFLRDVQGRRGIIDFRVKCDETNNTGEVIDRNEFVADIYIKPARSINFITLNFIAARTAVSFDEIGA